MTVCEEQQYEGLNYACRIMLILPISVLGLLANLINFLVYKHPAMRGSLVNWFLLTLSMSDMAILVTSFLILSLPVLAEGTERVQGYNVGAASQRWVRKIVQYISFMCKD